MAKKKDVVLGKVAVVEWLLDPQAYRREGRSYIMMLAYVRLAFKYPNTWIKVRDHHPWCRTDEMLLDMIKSHARFTYPTCDWQFKRDKFRLVREWENGSN